MDEIKDRILRTHIMRAYAQSKHSFKSTNFPLSPFHRYKIHYWEITQARLALKWGRKSIYYSIKFLRMCSWSVQNWLTLVAISISFLTLILGYFIKLNKSALS